ncbi:MAG: polysaccharide biosynthesis protein [Elusimicrobiota bacterium]
MRTMWLGLRRLAVISLDFCVVSSSFLGAFLFRFGLHGMALEWPLCKILLPFTAAAYLACFYLFSLYGGVFYFSSFEDSVRIVKAVAAGGVISAAAILFFKQGQFPRSVLVLQPLLALLGVGAVRFAIRAGKIHFNRPRPYPGRTRSVLIVGAGELGESLLRQIQKTSAPRYHVVGFIDDNPEKIGRHIHGVKVLGNRRRLPEILDKRQVDEIVIAIAARRAEVVRAVVESLGDREPRPELKIAPSLPEILQNHSKGTALRRVKPADLLNRDVVELDLPRIAERLFGKTVLISGAGGTIGSELCRQVLQFNPAKLVLVENHATALFYAEAGLRRKAHGARIVPALGDIRDQALLEKVFKEHRPHVVLHAAAHKHVHQLETNVYEGVSNNILGTYYLAAAAARHGAEVFLLISTDKAVRPASVMGATKRVAEIIVRHFARKSPQTRFIAVRFGNVLGSSGSAFRIFREQIETGGPVTVSHPDVQRYFMTVEEAAQLILQAVAMANGGEIFVLKMGAPVRILDMAKDLIRLSGLIPDKDIPIVITGLKQGEKINEELVENPDDCDDSGHPSILVLRPDDGNLDGVDQKILDLEITSRAAGPSRLVGELKNMVPTFTPAQTHLQDAPAD